MNETQKEKLKRFLDDKVMSDAVHQVLLKAFLEGYGPSENVNLLAASRISIDMLGEAWKELQKYQNARTVEEKERTQNAL